MNETKLVTLNALGSVKTGQLYIEILIFETLILFSFNLRIVWPWPCPLTLAVYYCSYPSLSCFLTTLVLTFRYLNDLLLHIDGVGDSCPVWPGLGVLPGLAASSQSQNLL